LSRGHRQAVDENAAFYEADLSDIESLASMMSRHRVESVIHFAALANVGESIEKPDLYHRNNVDGTVRLLDAMDRSGVKRMIFSSSCATYGAAEQVPIVETHRQQPESPYGWSKLDVEQILQDKVAVDPTFGFTALRYFNVGGCARDGTLGEDHRPETHLIPILLQTALGQRDHATVFGDDYPTPDGTCIRDYVHVEDICSAHLAAESPRWRPSRARSKCQPRARRPGLESRNPRTRRHRCHCVEMVPQSPPWVCIGDLKTDAQGQSG
jgi:UDP-glucose 4-epimerase